MKGFWILFFISLPLRVLTIDGFFQKKEKNANKERSFADPKFATPINNVTVAVSRDAVLTCSVHDLYQFKVAWLRVDTQTILTIQHHIITKNHRISITNTEKKIWELKIKEVKESDRGWYMCQINTDPMKSQMGYLNVVVSPDILDDPTSNDVIIQEYENVTVSCTASGSPEPTILWKREGHNKKLYIDNKESETFIGTILRIPYITRHQAGAYLCIASNGIPPTKSKRIKVVVNFKPKIFTHHRVIHAAIGQKVMLECLTESFPNSVNYWMRANPDFSSNDYVMGGSYNTSIDSYGAYEVKMKLLVKLISVHDFGVYKCIAKNALGNSEEIIKLLPSKTIDKHEFHPTSFISTYLNTRNESKIVDNDDIRFTFDIVNVSNQTVIVPTIAFIITLIVLIIII
ncbi:hypothetical protein ACKWTF_001270 [Chironomus riparius]